MLSKAKLTATESAGYRIAVKLLPGQYQLLKQQMKDEEEPNASSIIRRALAEYFSNHKKNK